MSTRFSAVSTLFAHKGKPLLSHQVPGIEWMFGLETSGSGGLLADDPGLGKTLQSLSLVVGSEGSTLIVVPKSIMSQWRDASVEMLGEYAVHIHWGPNRNKQSMPMTQVVITTYDTILRDKHLADKKWERIILDEAHKIKNRQTAISKAVMVLNGRYRWCLTGTPVQNRPEQTVNLFRFILGLSSDTTTIVDLPTMIRSHLLRRTKQEVLKEAIPELKQETVEVPFITRDCVNCEGPCCETCNGTGICNEEHEFHSWVQQSVKREFIKLGERCLSAKEENMEMFELLLRLRQSSQHPQLVLDGFTKKSKRKGVNRKYGRWEDDKGNLKPSSKHVALYNMMMEHPDEASLVFFHWTQEMDIFQRYLGTHGIPCQRLDGSTCESEREAIIQNSKLACTTEATGQAPILLIQIQAGGVGLNLQAFSRVYLISPDWNPCNEIQAIARAHRLGQRREVIVKKLILQCKEGESLIDHKIIDIQADKRELMADLLNEEALRCNGIKRKSGLSHSDYRKLLK